MASQRAAAKRHIQSFRAAMRLPETDDAIDKNDLLLANTSNLLEIVKAELYADSFHFIWEIIQNSDDAAYNNPNPELRIYLTDNTLYAWSNQTGFRKADVDSICCAGQSSKRGNADTIGEKGIGFKSLFAVADKVTIHSEPYHFKFDTTTVLGNLGMLVPSWVDEPSGVSGKGFAVPSNGTTVALSFKSTTNVNDLRCKLEQLDLNFLIFCRRLTQIQLSYHGKQPTYSKTGKLCDQTDQKITLQTQDLDSTKSNQQTYRLFSQTLKDMPEQKQRVHQTTSTVRLAFLIPASWTKGLRKEKTYAFMPMTEFGFNFMIHANFILTANRGEVVHGHAWNTKLRSGLGDCLHSALVWLATSADSPATFQWPLYARSLFDVHDKFFEPLARAVRDGLRSTPILLTDSLDTEFLQTPGKGYLLSANFRSKGRPILDGDSMAKESIKQDYWKDPDNKNALERLGTRVFNYHDFLSRFEIMTQQENTAFHNRSSEWHAGVAEVLLEARHHINTTVSRLRLLDIIPLNSGEWTTPKANDVFLPSHEMRDIPSGLTMKIVDDAACANKSRRLLFEILGIKSCTKQQICTAILTAQRTSGYDEKGQHTVSDLKFLFMSNYQPKSGDIFRFWRIIGKSDNTDRTMYIQLGKIGRAIREILGTASEYVKLLSPAYEKIPREDQVEEFVSWLQKWPQLGLWPPLNLDGKLSPVMGNLLSSKGTKAFLEYLFLRAKHGVALPKNNEPWTKLVKDLEVATNQGLIKLCLTALPTIAESSRDLIPALDIPEPADSTWRFLEAFGVASSTNASYLLQILRNFQATNAAESIGITSTAAVYRMLGSFRADDALIKQAFAHEALIYTADGTWVKLSSCRWEASYTCTALPLLSKLYGDCSSLFQKILCVNDANLDDLIEEFKTWVEPRDSPLDVEEAETLYQLLLCMNTMLLSRPATSAQVSEVKRLRVFPILETDYGEVSVRVLTAYDRFWIGDIPSLQMTFAGKIPLFLPLQGNMIGDLDAVVKTFGLDHRRLTRCVVSESASEESTNDVDEQLTSLMGPKIPYLNSLLKHAMEVMQRREELLAQLDKLRVFRVEGIKVRRYIQDAQVKIYGTDDEGEICLIPEKNSLDVHIDPELENSDALTLLAEQLGQYWDLNPVNRQLVHKVLTSVSSKRFIEAFERAGIKIPESEVPSSQWASSKKKFRSQSAKSGGTGSDVKIATLLQSIARNRNEASEVSQVSDDNDDENENKDVTKFATQNVTRATAPKTTGSSSRKESAVAIQWTEETASLSLVDDTQLQWERNASKKREHARSTKHAVDESPSKRLRPFTSQGYSQTMPPSTWQGRTRGRALMPSEEDLARNASQLSPKAALAASQPNGPHNVHSKSSPSKWASQNTGSPYRHSKKRKLDSELSAGSEEDEVAQSIGRAGERLVFDHCSRTLGKSFSHLNWTSRNRNSQFPDEPFMDDEWDFADFTYRDTEGILGIYLAQKVPGFAVPTRPSATTTYHLEVKTSVQGIDTPVVLSNNQLRMARQFAKGGEHENNTQREDVYVLVRVYGLAKDSVSGRASPKICFFPDPWDLIYQGQLAIEGDEGVYIRPL